MARKSFVSNSPPFCFFRRHRENLKSELTRARASCLSRRSFELTEVGSPRRKELGPEVSGELVKAKSGASQRFRSGGSTTEVLTRCEPYQAKPRSWPLLETSSATFLLSMRLTGFPSSALRMTGESRRRISSARGLDGAAGSCGGGISFPVRGWPRARCSFTCPAAYRGDSPHSLSAEDSHP